MAVALSERGLTTGQKSIPHYDVAVVGAGPAGLTLSNELLNAGITEFALIGRPKSGRGKGRHNLDYGGELATYDIRANSNGNELLLAIDDQSPLRRVNKRLAARRLRRMTDSAPNLKRRVAPYLRAVGREIERQKPNDVYAREVGRTVWDEATQRHIVLDKNNQPLLTADFISTNIGAHEQSLIDLPDIGDRFRPYAAQVRGSFDVIKGPERRKLRRELKRKAPEDRWVVVVGSSHTAFTDAAIFSERRKYWFMPKKIGDLLPDKHLVIAHRGEIKVFAETAAQAVAEGFVAPGDIKDRDPRICPRTKRWRRFGGFRWDAKRAYIEWLAGKRPQMDVVKLDTVPDAVLAKATIYGAVGVVGNELPIFDGATGHRYTLQRSPDGDIKGDSTGWLGIPAAYGNGIGVDVLRPDEELGGEPEFSDNPNGFLHFVAGYNEVARRQAGAIKDQLDQRRREFVLGKAGDI